MDLRTLFSRSKGNGARAYAKGLAYETAVRSHLQTLCYQGTPLQVSAPAGAHRTAHDLVVSPLGLTLEIKTRNAIEGGGCTLALRDGVLAPPEHSVLRHYLSAPSLWEGRLPSCLLGDRSLDTWIAEKSSFPGVYIPVPSSAVAEYYHAKGTQYLQIEGKGLYHTGEDVFGWGVPKFTPPCKIRIRLKQHGSGSVPQDVQACFNYSTRSLTASPLDLMDPTRLPPGFVQGAV